MKSILIFAGTTEGRQLAEYADNLNIKAYVSVATDYGLECAGQFNHVTAIAGRMDAAQISSFISEKQIDLVIDATHPFATMATHHIMQACAENQIEYIRCLREKDEKSEASQDQETNKIVQVHSVPEAVEYLKTTTGNILITTGSKELAAYTEIENYRERCFARVLSVKESVDQSIALGFEGPHLIAMQGPFSKEMNTATIRQTKATYFVTKESGNPGGFHDKLSAASETGTVLIIIGRPPETGKSFQEICHLLKNCQPPIIF